MADANTIKQHIMNHLQWDDSLRGADINVDFVDRVAILSGTVPNLEAHAAAQRDALSIPGVARVENRLVVRSSHAHPTLSDENLRSSVESVLRCTLDKGTSSIQVSATDGVVTLKGTTDSYWKKSRLLDLAASVEGVLDIKDETSVKRNEKAPDGAIKKEIVDALARMEVKGLERIGVDVKDGRVNLSGTVPTWSTAFDIEDTARRTSGVVDVQSNLAVE